MRTGPSLHPEAGMSDVWPLRILASTSSSGRARALPFESGFIAYTFLYDFGQTRWGTMLASLHRLENFAEPLECRPLAAERHDVPLEKGDNLLTEHARGRDFVDQDFRVA